MHAQKTAAAAGTAWLLIWAVHRLCRVKLQRQRPVIVMPRRSCARWSRACFKSGFTVSWAAAYRGCTRRVRTVLGACRHCAKNSECKHSLDVARSDTNNAVAIAKNLLAPGASAPHRRRKPPEASGHRCRHVSLGPTTLPNHVTIKAADVFLGLHQCTKLYIVVRAFCIAENATKTHPKPTDLHRRRRESPDDQIH